MAGDKIEKITIMVLKVDLQCSNCYKKVKKVLCNFPQIRDQVYDEKANSVTIKVFCCNPEKIRDKLCSKGGGVITSIEIIVPKTPGKSEKPPKQSEKPGKFEKPSEQSEKPGKFEKPPEQSEKPEKFEKPPEQSEKPGKSEKPPEQSEKPGKSEKPPEQSEKPGKSEKPPPPSPSQTPVAPQPQFPPVFIMQIQGYPHQYPPAPEPIQVYPHQYPPTPEPLMPIQVYPHQPPPRSNCCDECSKGYSGGPCYHHERQIQALPSSSCNSYRYGSGPVPYGLPRGCYVNKCDYFSEENASGCSIM